MNTLHMRYVVEVAKAGSINKAAQRLLIAQPNLSRSIKEVETDLGITIFERSAKGMFLTPEGEEFIDYATQILNQLDNVEKHYKEGLPNRLRFSVSVPRSGLVSDAFARFSSKIGDRPVDVIYKETGTTDAINDVIYDDYKLGIMRYAEHHEQYFSDLFEKKEMEYQVIRKFRHVLLMSKDCRLADKTEIRLNDLKSFIEIIYAEPGKTILSLSKLKDGLGQEASDRKIYVFERASRMDILSENKEAIMWISPVSERTLDRYNLVQRYCDDEETIYTEVVIYRKSYKLTEMDKMFIEEVKKY